MQELNIFIYLICYAPGIFDLMDGLILVQIDRKSYHWKRHKVQYEYKFILDIQHNLAITDYKPLLLIKFALAF